MTLVTNKKNEEIKIKRVKSSSRLNMRRDEIPGKDSWRKSIFKPTASEMKIQLINRGENACFRRLARSKAQRKARTSKLEKLAELIHLF